MSIVAVGSIALDTIKTPFGEARDIVGGALTHFSLAASYFADVNLVAVVGDDFGEEQMRVFAGRRIDLQGVERARGKTFRWGGEYSYNLNNRETLFTELNVFERFQPRLPEQYLQADIVYLGNIHPSLQASVLEQVTSKRLAGLDSMNLWIETTAAELREVLKRVDILKVDDSEARQLSGEYNLRKAAAVIQEMGPRMLVATRGSHGSMLFNESDIFAVTAYPLEDEVDPTGAGDSFAGGFFGYLAQKPSLDEDTLRRAVIFGSVMGSFCVEDFGTRRLERLTFDEILNRYRAIKALTHF
ncbi:MAG TPA: PfkB family carbohydrate kinase, partial [Dehalococcoidia bacterium]|nr:PfkB family carbohydrate kinase [Dehalococcoidia bacterium]